MRGYFQVARNATRNTTARIVPTKQAQATIRKNPIWFMHPSHVFGEFERGQIQAGVLLAGLSTGDSEIPSGVGPMARPVMNGLRVLTLLVFPLAPVELQRPQERCAVGGIDPHLRKYELEGADAFLDTEARQNGPLEAETGELFLERRAAACFTSFSIVRQEVLAEGITALFKPRSSLRSGSRHALIVVDPMPLTAHTLRAEHLHRVIDADVPVRVDQR